MSTFSPLDAPSPELISACVHCGFCLPTCPTYVLWNEEMDSPRGRIYLMKAATEGRTTMTASFVGHMDACLGCMACVTACPSGVQYGSLIEKTRAQIEQRYARPAGDRWLRRALFAVLPYPSRLRVLFAPLALVGSAVRAAGQSRAARVLPARLRAMLALAPPVSWAGLTSSTPARTPAQGERRMTVGLLTGCVQRVAFRPVNDATVRVLAAESCEVRAPRAQGCCGALALHAGEIDLARDLARKAIAAFDDPALDRIVVNAAGCGSAMKEYGELLSSDAAWAARAQAFSAKVRDVSEVLTELDPRAVRHPIAARVAYHDACHLAHAQGVRAAPRALLAAIPGLEVVTAAEAEICCGSAGIYNIVQPEPAEALGARKALHLSALQPDVVATGNPGCTLQIAASAAKAGCRWPVVHPIEILDASIRGLAPWGPSSAVRSRDVVADV
jgi:glycolate oxidase iron-sulfur subunit